MVSMRKNDIDAMNRPSRSSQMLWAALCAVWFAALAPTLANVLAAQGRIHVEVCSASGMRFISVDTGSHHRLPATPLSKHCPYCLLQQDIIAPPLASIQSLERRDLSYAKVTAAEVFGLRHEGWYLLPSRAPPLQA